MRLARIALGLTSLLVLHCGSSSREGFDGAPEPADTSASPTTPPPSSSPFATDAGVASAPDASACTEDIDVVLALDVSSSMAFVLDKLDGEIDKVVTASNALKAGAHFGLVTFVDNTLLDATGDAEGGKVHTGARTLRTAFANAKKVYTEPNRNPGDGPNGPTMQNPICEEDALDALHDAAAIFPWRASAARIVIVVTDDTFLEKPDNYGDRDGDGKTNRTDFPREGDYPAHFTVDETVAALKDAKARVFSFTRVKAPGLLDVSCGTGRRHSSNASVTYGWSKPYAGKAPIPVATGGKNFDLDEVRTGTRSLADTINEVVLETHCAGAPH